MRLLHFDRAERLISTDFSGKGLPPYAILSHRWGDSEVLFEDIANNTYKEKEGYRKIEFCAKQAAKDQLQYFWIDTCCIDKWNLNELSKSINLMFLWYKNSKKCYTFLPDVTLGTASTVAQRSDWEASFRKSEWFRRGWTLQELIAPASVEFFSSEGWLIGDKRSLEQLVYEITSIPIDALQNCPLDKFTPLERIKWAKNRETTEEEDAAYCLLGILNISMPTSYGEGQEKAWRRLEMEMNSSAPSIIPFSRNDYFIGREAQLAELEAKLFGGKQTTTVALVGPGGTGKSQLALELAYRTRQRNKSCSVFWIDASSADSVYQSYTSIARKLKIPGWSDDKTDIRQLVKLYLSQGVASQSLLIFDSADDFNLVRIGSSTTRAANLIDYLPQSELCSILFTTISCDVAERLASQIIELHEMTPDTAQSMLERYLNTPISRTEMPEAKSLLQELVYLPLAIVQAGAYINTRSITLKTYRSLLARQREEIVERGSESSEDKLWRCDIEGPVATTLLISLDQIRRDDPLAADYLFFAACIDRKDILLEFLVAATPRKRDSAIRIMKGYGLVTRRPAESAFDLHRLVHHALRGWLRKQEKLEQWTQTAIKWLLGAFPDDSHGSRSKWRRMLPHAMYALSHSPDDGDGTERMDLVWKCAMALMSDGRYSESEELFVQAIEARKRVFGDEHLDTLTGMANLAATYWNQGRWKEAEQLNVQVMETRKKVLSNEHLDTLTSMANLASMCRDQGRWREAEHLFVQIVETSSRVLGNEHPSTLTSVANLASTYWSQGRWKEAEQLFVQVIEIRRRVLGDEHPSTLLSITNLASTYWNQGRWKEAEQLNMQVVEMSSRVLGDEHPDTLTGMANLASTYREQGRCKEAEQLFMQVIETRKKVLSDEHPDTLTSIDNLVSIYKNQGRWEEAGRLEMQVMETRLRVLGIKHPDTLASMANLAITLKDLGLTSKAVSLMENCYKLRAVVLGFQHPDSVSSYETLTTWQLEVTELSVQKTS